MHLMERESVLVMKEELSAFLDNLEDLAAKGRYLDTGHKFELYVSNINIDSSYSYFSSNKGEITTYITFIVQFAASYNKDVTATVKRWILSLKRLSTLMSGAGERERILFFDEQRRILERLG